MCGITGILTIGDGITDIHVALAAMKFGLIALQNRGNDSFGLAYFRDSEIVIKKRANPNKQYFQTLMKNELEELTNDHQIDNKPILGHCRWSTHGRNTDINAHPHYDSTQQFALVHNGTIENYLELKEKMLCQDITFQSDTDSEVIVNLIAYYYQEFRSDTNRNNTEYEIIRSAVLKTISSLKGIWACALITTYLPNSIIAFSHFCPLILGWGPNILTLASEKSAFDETIKKYGKLKEDTVFLIDRNPPKDEWFKYIDTNLNIQEPVSPDPFPYWMLREIHEQEQVTYNLLDKYLTESGDIKLDSLEPYFRDLITSEHLILIGCGTSYYAGKYSRHFLTDLNLFRTVQCIDASEFDLSYLPAGSRVVCFLLSQSGETMDLIRVQEQLKEREIPNIAIVNVKGSSIDTGAQATVFIDAKREVAVASTKSYTNQVLTLRLISIWLQSALKINTNTVIKNLRAVPKQICQVIQEGESIIRNWAKVLSLCERVFILGKKIGYSIAKEASLKLKEVGYLHSEAYSASALKHGPYSLIEEGKPIIFIISRDDNNEAISNTIMEVKSRGALVYIVTDWETPPVNDSCIKTPYNPELYGILQIIPFQLLAYYLALEKGHNPDFPRNLAKSVTVD